ncbi:MAG TPA: DUF4870 domain-containing protein [Acidimicrobiia bacterium]|nr:DUF4870 domain-containing protein [Acidimicrobiia bacterium]
MADQQVSGDQQTWRVLAHASAFIQFLGVPSVVGPLIVWLLRRDDPVVEPHARAALNFQLSLLIYFLLGGIVAFVAFVTIIGIPIAALVVIFLLVLLFLELLFALLATLAASRGELYRYPMTLELVKG